MKVWIEEFEISKRWNGKYALGVRKDGLHNSILTYLFTSPMFCLLFPVEKKYIFPEVQQEKVGLVNDV